MGGEWDGTLSRLWGSHIGQGQGRVAESPRKGSGLVAAFEGLTGQGLYQASGAHMPSGGKVPCNNHSPRESSPSGSWLATHPCGLYVAAGAHALILSSTDNATAGG